MHVSFPGNLDLSPEKTLPFQKKIHLKPELQQLTPQNDFALGNVKKGCGGVRGRPDKVSYGWKEDNGGETIGLMNLSPTLLLQLLISFEVAREPWEAHFSLYFTSMDKGCSSPDDTLVPDILLILKQNKYHIT